jgi:hypothetical protein
MNLENLKIKIESIDLHLNEVISEIVSEEKDHFLIGSFNTNDLFDHNQYTVFPYTNPDFNHRINKLDHFTGDCLYWFETNNKKDAKTLNGLLCKYRSTKGTRSYRAVPTTNKLENKGSVIYVGVRKGKQKKQGLTNIMGRINQHLGYYKNQKTQGLQLYDWARDTNIEIALHVVHFDQDLGALLYVLEKKMAHQLRPHCGRH